MQTTMPDIRRLDESAAVAPQIDPADLPSIKAAGFATVINNRPDDEEPGQPPGEAIRAAAEAAGLRYVAIPFAGGQLTPQILAAMAQAMEHGPVLAFCRSGTRSCNLWALAGALRGDDPATMVEQAAAAGYDLTGLRGSLDQLSATVR